MVSSDLVELSDRIVSAGKEIQDQLSVNPDHPNVSSFRELRHYCEARIFESQLALGRFVCFFLSNFIDTFFSNLGGDTPYDEQLQRVRLTFYARFSESLVNLGIAVRKEDQLAIVDSFSKSVSFYAESVTLLNEL